MDASQKSPVATALVRLLREILSGSSERGGWLLNAKDPGLLASLDRLSAAEASAVPPDGSASVASHAEHLRYSFSLLNRWTADHNPFAGADWGAAWKQTHVTDDEWARLRAALRERRRGSGRRAPRGCLREATWR